MPLLSELKEIEHANRQSSGDSVQKVAEKSSNEALEDLARRTGDLSVYAYYLRAVGKVKIIITIFISLAYIFCLVYPRTSAVKSIRMGSLTSS